MSKPKKNTTKNIPEVLPPLPIPNKFSKKRILLIFLIAIVLLTASISATWLFLLNRFYPGTTIASNNVSLLTKPQATEKIKNTLTPRIEKPITFSYQNGQKQLFLTQTMLSEVLTKSIEDTFTFGHTHFNPKTQKTTLDFSSSPTLQKEISKIESQINEPPIDSQLRVQTDQINVTPSQDGTVVDSKKLIEKINSYINEGTLSDNRLPTINTSPKLSYTTALEIKKRLDQIRLNPLTFTFKQQSFSLDLPTLITLIDLDNSDTHLISAQFSQTPITISSLKIGSQSISDAKLLINIPKAEQYFKQIASQIDQDVQEPLFSFDPTSADDSKVKEFKPPVEGQKLKIPQAIEQLSQALLSSQQNKIELPVEIITPTNKLTNELGIKELVGSGNSSYAGSIENRIFNVSHGASKINGVMIAPGETFSFTKTVGDITAATGFKQAYVIKSGRTVLDDGGGICQVSTTLFRAALNAGLPIVERTAHAYRVGYYEQGYAPGIDATIFYPSVDFQFKNDTAHHILIQTTIRGTNLTIDLYGTKDGREVELTKPVISGQTPAPPELRQDDPTLPKGTIKQVDWAAAGANVSFKRIVKKDGVEIINETFKSNYRPWQAVFLVGTKEG